MWIVLTLACALSQSLWMALSKRRLQTLTPLQFMLFFRIPVVFALAPPFFMAERVELPARFWGLVLLAGAVECVRLLSFAYGTRHDYYATYTLKNTAPVFVLLLAPSMLGEGLTWVVYCGVACVVTGAFVYYHTGRFRVAGMVAGVSQGLVTVLCKLGLDMARPQVFPVLMYGASTLMLLAMESFRSGLGSTARTFRSEAKNTLPLSVLNIVAAYTYMYALYLAPATHFTILFRTSLVFGFLLSFFVLKEHEGWRPKLAGAAFIVFGSILIALHGG